MHWSKETPTIPGWYWMKGAKNQSGLDVVLLETQTSQSSQLMFEWPTCRSWTKVDSEHCKTAKWFGPMIPPKE